MEMGIAAKNAEARRIVIHLFALPAMRTVGAGSIFATRRFPRPLPPTRPPLYLFPT